MFASDPKKNTLSFAFKVSAYCLWSNIKKGSLFLFNGIITMISCYLYNLSIIHSAGEWGATIWSAGNLVITFVIIFTVAASETNLSLGEEYIGRNDTDGFRHLIRQSELLLAILTLLILLLSLLFPNAIISIAGENKMSLNDSAITPLRLVLLTVLASSLPVLSISIMNAIGKEKYYIAFSSIVNLAPALITVAFALFLPKLIWWSFLFGTILALVIFLFTRHLLFYYLDMMDKERPVRRCDILVPYAYDAIIPTIDKIRCFDKDVSFGAGDNHAIEELLYNIIKHSPQHLKKQNLSISVTADSDSMEIVFMDCGYPFNPVRKFDYDAIEAERKEEKMMLSLRLFNHYAQHASYKYNNGINTTTIRLTSHLSR